MATSGVLLPNNAQRMLPRSVWLIAVAVFVLHMWANRNYGVFRDELNYVIGGERLAWGYVDHPPLVPFITRVARALVGESLAGLRFVPAAGSAMAVLLAALVAREFQATLGRSGSFGQVLAALSVAIAPMYLSNGSFFTTNSLEPFFWAGCAWFAIRAIRLDDPRYWLGFGVLLGLGLLDKYSLGIYAAGIALGLVLTQERRQFRCWKIWIAAGLAFLIFLPNLLWNLAHGFPFLELMRNIQASGRDVVLSPARFLVEQTILIHPLNTPVWVAGLAFLFSRRLQSYRFLGWAFLATSSFFIVTHGKNYYLTPAYVVLLAAGAVFIAEKVTSRSIRGIFLATLAAGGLALLPITVPLLAPDRLLAYLDSLPFDVPRTEVGHTAALPQHYADQFGWSELADLAGRAWQHLPENDRRDCPFYGQNYGQAGAIDYFARSRYGMAPALSGHQTYFLWGPQNHSGQCLLVADDEPEVLGRLFEEVTYLGATNVPYAQEGSIPLYLCRRLRKGTLDQLWPKLKKWN